MTATAPWKSHSQEIQFNEDLASTGSSASIPDTLTLNAPLIPGRELASRIPTTMVDLSSVLYGEVTSLPIANVSDFFSNHVYWAFVPQAGKFLNAYLSWAKPPSRVSFDLGMTGEHMAFVLVPEPVTQNEVSAIVELVPPPKSWVELAYQALPGCRSMSDQERAEFDALRAPLTKPLSKPLKKLPPR